MASHHFFGSGHDCWQKRGRPCGWRSESVGSDVCYVKALGASVPGGYVRNWLKGP